MAKRKDFEKEIHRLALGLRKSWKNREASLWILFFMIFISVIKKTRKGGHRNRQFDELLRANELLCHACEVD
jgi:hypothetical protein